MPVSHTDAVAELVVDTRLWRNWRNVRYNAGIRSVFWAVRKPVRVVGARRRSNRATS